MVLTRSGARSEAAHISEGVRRSPRLIHKCTEDTSRVSTRQGPSVRSTNTWGCKARGINAVGRGKGSVVVTPSTNSIPSDTEL
ncbi:hypothetical protein FOZ62_023707 [Perkinsus olseni]|uniref:Uncharacterized protein n=1 Tax=Perkinsus olseni TaxID=32597 RepID=A0A7J6TYU7_PEROL|nr:hypothetical protein FOZ62_023707 [Perkinsus olseni]